MICLVLRSPFRRAPRHYLYQKTHMMGANLCTQKISENQDNFRKHQSSRQRIQQCLQFQYFGKYCIGNHPECNFFQHIPRNHTCGKSKIYSPMDTFAFRKIPVVPLAGRFKHFIDNRKVLTYEQNILSVIKGYRIPFQSQPVKQKILREKIFRKVRRLRKC